MLAAGSPAGEDWLLHAGRGRSQDDALDRQEALIDLREANYDGAQAGIEAVESRVHFPQVGTDVATRVTTTAITATAEPTTAVTMAAPVPMSHPCRWSFRRRRQ